MPLTKLKYNANSQDHMSIGMDLGLLIGGINKGKIDRDTPRAYFAGHEIATQVAWKDPKGYYLKKDLGNLNMKSAKKGATGRTPARVFVRIEFGEMVPNWAGFWDHDDKALELDKGFFDRASGYEDM